MLALTYDQRQDALKVERVPRPQLAPGEEAAFCEPLAAAMRIVEQGLVAGASLRDGPPPPPPQQQGEQQQGEQQQAPQPAGEQRIAVVGDGRLGLLIAQVLAVYAGPGRVTHLGRHERKLALVEGTAARVVVPAPPAAEGAGEGAVAGGGGAGAAAVGEEHAGAFDLVVEASGAASGGVRLALALVRPMGVVCLKTTVSAAAGADTVAWAELCNDVVVNEKSLVGSRCGPMNAALSLMARSEAVRRLLRAMLQHEPLPLARGVEAMELAARKGVLKVQLLCSGGGGGGNGEAGGGQ